MLIYLQELQNSSSSSTQSDQKENSQLIRYSPPVLDSLPSVNAVILPGNQKPFDLIIKSPNKSLITKLSRPNGVESKINDFLDDIFDLSPDRSEQIDPPLVYDDHEAIMQNGLVTGIKVRFRPRDNRVTASSTASLDVCSRIHSPEVRERKKCNDLSHLDIFGLEPVPYTEFSAIWDAAFLNQLVQDGKQLMSFISRTMVQATQREIVNCTWLRFGIHLFTELLQTKPNSSTTLGLFQKIACNLKHSDLEVLMKSLFEQATSLLEGIKLIWSDGNTQSKWQNAVRDVNNAYEEILTRITDFLNFMDSPLSAQRGIRNSAEAMERTQKMYHSFRVATEASIRAAMSNEKVWDIFYAKRFGSGLSAAVSAYSLFQAGLKVTKSGFTNANAFQTVLSIGGLGLSLKSCWDQWTYCGYCNALETFLGSGRSTIFYCDILTRIVFLQQDRDPQQFQQLEEHEWFRKFIDDLYWDTGLTPKTMTVQGYKNYLECQRDLLNGIMKEVKNTVQSVCGTDNQGNQETLQSNEDELRLVVTIAP